MKKNALMWESSPQDIKERLESLPWVKEAIVRRCLPHTIEIHLKEHQPFAMWHHGGTQKALDALGNVIEGVRVTGAERSRLIHISGLKAPNNLSDLVCELYPDPIFSRIKIALFLRSGRWDLYLRDGTLIQCPEENIRRSIEKMRPLQGTLDKSSVIDLRFDSGILYKKK